MAEGFEPYHVPQQSRRDKLRVLSHHNQTSLVDSSPNLPPGLVPLYDPSLISSDLLSNPNCVVKEEASQNLMGFSSSSLDPQSSSSLPINLGTIQVINNNPFLYPPQNLHSLREFDHSYDGTEIMVYKPEPLSLSLSSHNTNQTNLPLELNLERYGSLIYDRPILGLVGGSSSSAASASNEVSRSSIPLGPFTGYASVLKGSRFLKPAQQLLEELCDVGGRGIYTEKITPDASLMETPSESLSGSGICDNPLVHGGESRKKKSKLLTMLDEVFRRYRQYYQQMQAVITSFEYVAGLENAAPYASLAIKSMSKHFRCLKNAITDQLHFTNKAHLNISNLRDESPSLVNNDKGPYSERPVQNPGMLDHQPVWRPQRGLPERAVTVLRAWLFEHFLHPYPTDTDKLMLAKQTGLSRSQVSNWFINARVRLWKPMVEEIHMLETRQAQKNQKREENNKNSQSDHLTSDNSLVSENPSTSANKFLDAPYKRTRNELANVPVRSQEQQLNLQYTSNQNQPVDVGRSMGAAGSNNSVSLTLGLHQNHGIGLSESFPMSSTHRFGVSLEPSNEGYVLSGFESQNQHFGRDVLGGQLLHDFVG